MLGDKMIFPTLISWFYVSKQSKSMYDAVSLYPWLGFCNCEIIGVRGKETQSYWFQSHLHLWASHRTLRKKKGRGKQVLLKFPVNVGSVSCISAVCWHTCLLEPGHESYNQCLMLGQSLPDSALRLGRGQGWSLTPLLGCPFLIVSVEILD